MTTSVCITVDTEASIARSLGQYAEGYRPLLDPFVACTIAGRSEGVGFLIRTLTAHGLSATFFVEAAQSAYFGPDPMGQYVEQMLGAGQDVQLHVHPAWLNFRNGPPNPDPAKRLTDACADYAEDDLVEIFDTCIATYRSWTGQFPAALRTGSFSCNRTVFRAIARSGIPLSSNICVGVVEPDEPEYRRPSGWFETEGVREFPVTCFVDRHPGRSARYRPLQVTACSAAELITALDQAHALGMREVVLVTHPFEFIRASSRNKHTAESYARMLVNRNNQKRFEQVCAHLADNPDRFQVSTFADWAKAQDAASRRYPELEGSATRAVLRTLENLSSDRLPW